MKALLVLLVLGSAQGRLTCPTYEELATPEASHLDPFKYQVRWLFQGDVRVRVATPVSPCFFPRPPFSNEAYSSPSLSPYRSLRHTALILLFHHPFPLYRGWAHRRRPSAASAPHQQSSVDPHLTSAHHTPPHPAGLLVRGIQPQRVPGGRLPLHAVRSSGRGMCCVESDRCAGP